MNEKNILDGEALCKECGLCCKGIFHLFVSLSDHEINILKKTDVNFKFNKKEKLTFFTLPCPAFDGYCSIYQQRPSACSEYRCNLLQSIINEETTIQDALIVVDKMKSLYNDTLEELQALSENDKTNFLPHLLKSELENLENQEAKNEFKKEHKKLLMKFAVYNFFKNKYFDKK